MIIINIELEDSLSAVQVLRIKDLLGLIKGVVRVTGAESYQLATLNSPEPGGSLVLTQRQQRQIDFDNINPEQKKHIISQSIAWGSKHGKITLSVLKKLSPEEMLGLATKFLGEMTDDERDVIFR